MLIAVMNYGMKNPMIINDTKSLPFEFPINPINAPIITGMSMEDIRLNLHRKSLGITGMLSRIKITDNVKIVFLPTLLGKCL